MKMIKNIRLLLLLVIVIGIHAVTEAAGVSFTVKAPRVVEVGEQFRVSFSVNAKGSNFGSPSFNGFRILSGPNVSTSSSVQIINGNMSKSVTYTYNFVLMAEKAGKFTIDPATVVAGGKKYQTAPKSIEVVAGSQQQASSGTSGGSSSTGMKPDKANINNKDIFVAVNVNKRSLYQGESLVAEIKVYTRKSLSGFDDIKFPPFTGFWSRDIEAPTQIQLHRENVNGQIYDVGLFKKVLLFPQHSGKITIDPFEITMITQQRVRSNNPFDDFFGGSYKRVPYKLASKPVTINVKPLPANKPESFKGAVGRFNMTANVDKTQVKANEAINLKIRVSGNGNLKLIEPVSVDFPPDFDVYDPKTSLNTKATESGVNGSVTFTYLFIPRFAGTYRIAPIVFSYFDTKTKTYKTITSKEFEINVERGSGDEEMTSGVVQGLSKEEVKFIGKDIRFLKTNIQLKKKSKSLYGSRLFYLIYVLGITLFILIIIVRRTHIKQNANQAKVRNRKANKVSRKRLKKASSFMKQGNDEQFYDEVLKAMWGYLSDKLVIPVANLSKDNVSEILEKRGVDKELIEELIWLLDSAEFARFAPSSIKGGMEELYKKAGKLISKLDQKIK